MLFVMGRPDRKPQGKVAQAADSIVKELPMACQHPVAATEFLERRRWGDTPACPWCGSVSVYQMKDAKTGERNADMRWRCHERECHKQFTVRTGTVFEDSRIPLQHWCLAFWLMSAGKKGVSAKQIQRQTGLSYKSALFLAHRVRFAMTPADPTGGPKLTGTVEADETYVGGKPRHPNMGRKAGPHDPWSVAWSTKSPVVAIVQRGGDVRAMVVQSVNSSNLRQAIRDHVEPGTRIITDEAAAYIKPAGEHGQHERVRHNRKEYVRSGTDVHTNTIEGFFSRLKRQMYGTHHAVSKKHLHRYVAECAFKHNTRHDDDGERTAKAIKGAEGKRLVYREPKDSAA